MNEVAMPEEKKDRIERLADRVLAAGMAAAARGGDRRVFTLQDVRAEFPDLNAQRLNDALKTLKDRGSLVIVARSTYRIEEGFAPPRTVSASVLNDGHWLLEIGDDVALPITPEEARRLGLMLSGHAAKAIFEGDMREMRERLWGMSRENEELRRQIARGSA